jgi:ketosteroid isomerase-like protein
MDLEAFERYVGAGALHRRRGPGTGLRPQRSASAHSVPDINEQWAHLLTVRDGKAVRLQQFRARAQALEAAGVSE